MVSYFFILAVRMCQRNFERKGFVACLLLMISSGAAQDFGYFGDEGPDYWPQKFQHCGGKHQSPINILKSAVFEVTDLPPLVFANFDKTPDSMSVENNGNTIICTLTSAHPPEIAGGPLVGTYQLAQLHFHWGEHDWEGSENRINNSSYPLELHLVLFNNAYGTIDDAMVHPDGLTVLSFLYSRTETRNNKYDPLINALTLVSEVGYNATLVQPPSLMEFLNEDRSVYFTFGGSLTTPPCSEIVTWIVFQDTIPLSHSQLRLFRDLNGWQGKLTRNYRNVQPLYGRIVRMSTSDATTNKSQLLYLTLITVLACTWIKAFSL